MVWFETASGRSPARSRKSVVPSAPVVPSLREALQPFSAVVVTGGSSGIGKSFIELSQTVAPQLVVCNLSRRAPAKKFPDSTVRHFPCDLAQAAQLERAAAEVQSFLERAVPTGRILLINNSGFGTFGRFQEANLAQQLEMIDLNARAVVHLTGLLLPLLHARGGAIITICSTMSFQPTPYSATYGATKAFALHWSLALNEELRGSGVHALAVCPGTTRTEFFREAGLGDGAVWASLSMSSEEVVAIALRALAKGRAQIVPGWKNKVYTFAGSKVSKPFAAKVSAKVLGQFRLGKTAP
jgi:short-subunit dehydrogenase